MKGIFPSGNNFDQIAPIASRSSRTGIFRFLPFGLDSREPREAAAAFFMAVIGVLTLELHLEFSHSLKEKRHVIESLKDRLRHKFNVAVAEIDYHDTWQRSVIAAVTVSNDQTYAEKVLRATEEEAASMLGGGLVSTSLDWVG